MYREEDMLNELKALLANCPKQRVDFEEGTGFVVFRGEFREVYEGLEEELDEEDEDFYDDWDNYEEWVDESYTVNSIYINENNELRFDLIKEAWNHGNYCGEEELKNVTMDFILNDSCCDVDLDEFEELIKFLKKTE